MIESKETGNDVSVVFNTIQGGAFGAVEVFMSVHHVHLESNPDRG
jgi:hypothetical protein